MTAKFWWNLCCTFLETSFCGTCVWIWSCWVWRRPPDGNSQVTATSSLSLVLPLIAGTIPSIYLHLFLSFGPVVSSGLHLVLIRSSHSIKDKVAFSEEKEQCCNNIFLPVSPRCLFLTRRLLLLLSVIWKSVDWTDILVTGMLTCHLLVRIIILNPKCVHLLLLLHVSSCFWCF